MASIEANTQILSSDHYSSLPADIFRVLRLFFRPLIFFVGFLCASLSFSPKAFAVDSADSPATHVASELERLTAAAKALPAGAKKRDALRDLAELRELSGDIEGAVSAWTDAAFAEPSLRDDSFLLSAARCLLSLGEVDKAFANVRTVLLTGRDASTVKNARYLGAQIAALRGDPNSISDLSSFVDNSDYSDRQPCTLYLLWRLSGDEVYRTRLMTDHASSPEARIAASDYESKDEKASVNIASIPLWLLFPGDAAVSLSAISHAVSETTDTSAEPPAAVGDSSPQATPIVASSSDEGGPIALQIGLFRKEENALALVKRLVEKGFQAEAKRKKVRAEEYWAVVVPPGVSSPDTILRLKNAGFESFPLF